MRLKQRAIKKRTLLLVRLDRLGDYILFRNFIEATSKSKKYSNYKIYLCGNEDWQELGEKLDSDFVEDFIWIDRKKFLFNIFYKWKILSTINRYGFEVAIESTYSREHLFGDTIIAASNAPLRIGSYGEPIPKINYKRELVTNKFYTWLINTGEENIFEFYRNKIFFEKALDEHISIIKPIISKELSLSKKLEVILENTNKFIVICPGAYQKVRMWSSENYRRLVKLILNISELNIIVTGTKKDKYFTSNIVKFSDDLEKVIDLTGQTSLIDLTKLISSAEIVITQDSAPFHLAASFNKKAICISNGFHYGRFVPYPEDLYSEGQYLFPPLLTLSNTDSLRFGSKIDINRISPDMVIDKIKNLI